MSAPDDPVQYPDLPLVPAPPRVGRDIAAVLLISLALLGAVAIAWTVSPRVGGLATCAVLFVVGVAVGYDSKE